MDQLQRRKTTEVLLPPEEKTVPIVLKDHNQQRQPLTIPIQLGIPKQWMVAMVQVLEVGCPFVFFDVYGCSFLTFTANSASSGLLVSRVCEQLLLTLLLFSFDSFVLGDLLKNPPTQKEHRWFLLQYGPTVGLLLSFSHTFFLLELYKLPGGIMHASIMLRKCFFLLFAVTQTTSHASGFAKDGSLPSLKSAQQAVTGGREEIKRFKESLRQRCETSLPTIDENLLTIAGDRLAAPTVFALRIRKAAVMVSVSYHDILTVTGHGTGLYFWQSPSLLCALIGRNADCLAAKRMLSKFDEESLERTGQRLSAAQISLCLADDAHDRTVESSIRPLAYNALVIGRDRNNIVTTSMIPASITADEPLSKSLVRKVENVGVYGIFKIDVSGNFLRCQGAAVGRMCEEVERWLRTRGAYLATQRLVALEGASNNSSSSQKNIDASVGIDEVGEDADLQLCLRVAQSCLSEVFGRPLLVAEALAQPLALVTLSTGVVGAPQVAIDVDVDGEGRGGDESDSDKMMTMTPPVAVNCSEVFVSNTSFSENTGGNATAGGGNVSDSAAGTNELVEWWQRQKLRQRRTRWTSR